MNGCTDCAEIWCVVRNQFSYVFHTLSGGVHMHVRTCVPFSYIPGTAERFALKFGRYVRDQLARQLTPISARPSHKRRLTGRYGDGRYVTLNKFV